MNEGGLTAAALIRLPISAAVWMLVGELLAYSTSQLRARTELLADQVATDALTGLGSRRSLPDLLAAARPGDGLVMLDLDHFHDVNASRGHAGGDRVLADFGAAVRASLRGQDRAVRYGGEEVLLLLPGVGGTSPTVSTANLDGALTRLRETWSRLQPEVTFSGGGVILQPGQSATSTVQAADRLLFAAKQAGRDCWRLAAGQSAQVATVPAARSENPASLTERRS
jgi:diguanylate cyclase (GGDEF)-like protein